MTVLVVDNNLHLRRYPQASIVRAQLALAGAAGATVRSADALSERDLDVDRVILTGSTAYVRQEQPWMEAERRLLDGWMKRDVPVLGICFGAQLVARHLFEQFNPLQMTVILFAYLDLKSIEMALEGNRLVDFEFAEEKRGYGGGVGFHAVSR